VRTVKPRVAAAVTGAGLYVVGGWLLVSRLLSVGIAPTDQSAPAAAPTPSCTCAAAAPRHDRGAAASKVLTVYVADGATYNCVVPVHLVSADAIMITRDDYQDIWRALDCT
jgi:hypothetical protein